MNKRLIAALCLICSIVLAVGGCAPEEEPNFVISVDTLTAVPVPSNGTVSPHGVETLGPDSSLPPFDISPSPFAVPTPIPTPRSSVTPINPTQTPGSPHYVTPPPGTHTFVPGQPADQSVFDNCAFVGNSIFEGLHLYGVITHGKFFTKVGLNLNTVYTATTTNGSKHVIDELNTGAYSGVVLMFGQNELGWPNQNAFIQRYEKLVKDIKARQSGAQIFLTGIPPVTKKVSDTKPEVSGKKWNEIIDLYNSQLAELALRLDYCHFIYVPEELYGPDDTLPESASGDGIHLNMTYSRIWADSICTTVMSVLWG